MADDANEAFQSCAGGDYMSMTQAYSALSMMGKSPESLQIKAFWDKNEVPEEGITSDQFQELCSEVHNELNAETLTEALKVFDKDDNGTIEAAELEAILKATNQLTGMDFDEGDLPTLEDLIQEGDASGAGESDGKLQIAELVAIIVKPDGPLKDFIQMKNDDE